MEIVYTTAPDCDRCTWDVYVPHFNCLYNGEGYGHSADHCTAGSCY